MLQRVVKTGKLIQDELFSSYAARHSLFLLNNNHQGEIQPEVPKTFHFLQHVYRAQTFLPIHHSPKSFLNTEIVTSMNQHYACNCGYQKCDYYHIDINDRIVVTENLNATRDALGNPSGAPTSTGFQIANVSQAPLST